MIYEHGDSRRLLILFGVGLITVLLTWASRPVCFAQGDNPVFQQAFKLMDDGQPAKAEKVIRSYIDSKGDGWEAYMILGTAQNEQKDYPGSIKSLTRSIELLKDTHGDCAQVHVNLGNSLLATGNAKDAIVQFGIAAKIQKNEPRIYLNMGKALVRVGRLYQSLYSYDKAELFGFQLDSASQLERTAICRYLGLLEEEKTNTDKLKRLVPPEFTAAKIDDAMKSVIKSLKQDRDDNAESVGLLASAEGFRPEAIKFHELALAQNKDNQKREMILYNLAECYKWERNFQKSETLWKELIAMQLKDPKAKETVWLSFAGLGTTYARQHKCQDAVLQFQKAFSCPVIEYMTRPYLVEYSHCLNEIGKVDEAKAIDQRIKQIQIMPGLND